MSSPCRLLFQCLKKHYHVTETTNIVIIHANNPLKFWEDVVHTTRCLINKMSSSTIQNNIFHSILFSNEVLFWISHRVFASVTHDLTLGLDKLFAYEIKCVFLRYSRVQKGFGPTDPPLETY